MSKRNVCLWEQHVYGNKSLDNNSRILAALPSLLYLGACTARGAFVSFPSLLGKRLPRTQTGKLSLGDV